MASPWLRALQRRAFLAELGLVASSAAAHATQRKDKLDFPRDFGAHPDHQTEWWYVTGHLQGPHALLGFQITFFQTRVQQPQPMTSRFAAHHLLMAHAAVTDLHNRRHWHEQHLARPGFGIASAHPDDTAVHIRDWLLERHEAPGGSRYVARAVAQEFELALDLRAHQPVWPQGASGWSRKGPRPEQASWYYSEPQLLADGQIRLRSPSNAQMTVGRGKAWLDHEWSHAFLPPEAIGWDWAAFNLNDGSALMVFRIRGRDGQTLWTGGGWRSAAGRMLWTAQPQEDILQPAGRRWHSPSTGGRYPMEWQVRLPSGIWHIQALLDNQELAGNQQWGTVYWEGLSELRDPQGVRRGMGYLEMTGYAGDLKI